MNRKRASKETNGQQPSSARGVLAKWLRGGAEPESAQRVRLMLETLEPRQLLAGDVELLSTDPQQETFSSSETAALFASSSLQAEGEAANDLVAFAKALADAGVTFFGAAWCPFCTQQKALFGDGKEELPFVEVTNPDRTLNSIGQSEGITTFPTWEFSDGTRVTGVQTLEQLSQLSGVSIPQSDLPIFAPVGPQTVEIGSPLHIPIDAYDPDSENLTVTVSVADPTLLTASVTSGNRSAKVKVKNWGEMVFELFEDKAPRATSRFIELAQDGFYNQSADGQIIFHRVIDNFVLQAGDPTGTGSGGSDLGDFDDQFHPDLQHNRTGVLSYAKSLDDTNDSQFFITEGQQRHLDYNHSIFGQLVEGDVVREAISETAVTSSKPNVDIVIESVEIFQDNENSLVMLKPTGTKTGTTDVTITVTDADGHTYTEVVTVTVIGDQVNAAPYLKDIADVSTPGGTPAVFTVESIDLEGDAVVYEARVIDSSGATAAVNQSTGQVTVTPAANYSGPIKVEVAVRSSSTPTSTSASTRSSTMDLQEVTVNVGPSAPTGVTLVAASDTGISNSDGITNTAPVSFTVTGVNPGATVEVLAGDTQIGIALATGTTVTVTTNNFAALGNATHIVTARQTVNGVVSSKSPSITVTYDTVAPAEATGLASQATVGIAYVGNLAHTEEGAGLRYSLVSGPAGLTINDTQGVVNWTPTAEQAGNQNVTVRLTDAAGNSREQSFTINVGAQPLVTVRLEATDVNGNVLQELTPGQEFLIKVYGDDERLFGTAQGIYALYLDMFFDSDLAEPVLFTPAATELEPNPSPTYFTYSSLYTSGKSGTVGDGVIEELGAFSSQSSFLGAGERFIFSVRMKALGAGTLTVTTDPAEESGHEVALFDRDDEVPSGQVAFGSLSINIDASFTVQNDSATVAEDSSNTDINVLANDTILTSGTTLTLSGVSSTSSQGGLVAINGNQVRYSPAANFNGTDTFTYTVSDGTSTQTGTVTVTVTPVNDAPTAVDDTISFAGNSQSNLIDVLANDTISPDTGETLRVTAVGTGSQGGTLTIGTGGAHILYTPANGFVGTETFTYTVSDGSLTDTATVTVTVTQSNPPPTAVNDSFTVQEDAADAQFDVLANDSNSDPEETFGLDSIVSADHGVASISGDGTRVVYRPEANFFGVDKVVYQIRDSNGATARATITFTVTAVNDAPPATTFTKSFARGSTAVNVLDVDALNAQNVDGTETLTFTAVGTTANGGTVSIDSANGRLLYTPSSSTYVGSDSFTYTVRDAGGLESTGTVNVTVLDYQPRDFAVDLSAAWMTTAADVIGQGYSVQLRGTDFQGNTVNTLGTLDSATGMIKFADQAPGEYEVVLPAIPFLSGAQSERVLALSSAADDTNASLNADFGNLQSQYISRKDFLSSAPTMAAFVIVKPGQNHVWMSTTSPSGMPQNIVVSLSADGQQLRVETDATSGSGRVAATINLDHAAVDHRGEVDGYHLFRLDVNPQTLTYTAVTTGSGEGESVNATSLAGEGEGVVNTAAAFTSMQTPSSTSTNTTTSAGTQSRTTVASDSSEGGVDAAGQTQTLAAEGEAGPIDNSSAGVADAIGRGEGENITVDRSKVKAEATDDAMLDLLPNLQLRSPIGEALAAEGATDTAAFDSAFSELGKDLI